MTIISGRATNGNDNITADGANDTIKALAGDDTVDAGAGNDQVYGGGGYDILRGGLGNDSLWGGSGYDELYGGEGSDRLYGDSSDNLWGEAGDDILSAGGSTGYFYGGEGNDTLLGGDGYGQFYGGSGDDYVDGGEGSSSDFDYFHASADANFTLTNNRLVGEGTDTLVNIEYAFITGGASNNIIDASASTLEGILELDGAQGNDTVIGSSRADNLYGGSGSDYLTGGNGNDIISGFEGLSSSRQQELDNDTLIGGNGADYFALGSGWGVSYQGASSATITDFSISAGDKIGLYGSANLYNFQLGNFGGSSSVQDTAIYYGADLLGVVQDVNLIGANVFSYIPPYVVGV